MVELRCCGPEAEPLMQAASNGLMPPTSKAMPSALCSVHAAFVIVIIAGIAMAIVDAVLLHFWWVIPIALLVVPFLFALVYTTMILASPQFGMWSTSSRLQIPLMQHPGCLLSRIVMPWINFGQGLNMCSNAWCHKIRENLGKTYVMAGMVVFADFEAVALTLKSTQVRTQYLGAQPLTNVPKVDRAIFLLGLANVEKGNMHEKFVACFYHYMFNVGFAERVKSEKAKRFWDQLAEDYKNMPHGEGEQFYTEDAKGLRGFFIRYFFYVMLETDTEDPAIMKDLVAMMRGDEPIGYCYLWPMAIVNWYGSIIKAVDNRIFNSAVMSKFVEGEERFGSMTKLELTRLTTCIMRLAAITGTLQLAKTITGGLSMPAYADMDKIDVVAEWDKLNLRDTHMLENFCLEVARLFPPVSSVHHVATEPFSAVLQGRTVDFPAGTKILVPTNLAMTEKETWGVDAFKFDLTRPHLREKSMVFANVGKAGSRICPGMNLALDTCVEILRVLGKVRREGK